MGALLNLLALGVLVAVIWFGGQYAEIATRWRILAIVGVLVLWLLLYLWQRLRAIRTARMIERRLREQAADQIASARPAERDQVEELQKRLNDAIGSLKSSKLGKAALAQLPWYIIIGPPGSGKSTALQESGLEFPKMGGGLNGIQGVGGTRNCEWWFTSEGILLDTAGRYTTVDEDRDEWLSFLRMIKRARNRTPINGALVAISVPELLAGSQLDLERHAKAVRERLDELSNELEEVFPVYLMFTKCDLLQGFVDFFESLGRNQRQQVWGYTFPYEELSAERYKSTFAKELETLYERLARMRLQLMAVDRPPAKMQRLYSFPLQFAAVQERLTRFVELTFQQNPFKEQPILRGFYFTSGTQEGRPIDQVLGALREAFGVTGAPTEDAEPAPSEKKSYFLHDLFKKIVFPDRDLARSLASTELRRRIAQMAIIVGALIASLSLSTAFAYSFFRNRGLVSRVEGGVEAVRKLPEKPKPSEQLIALEQLRGALDDLHEHEVEGTPIGLTWGLYQGGNLYGPARKLYFRQLHGLLLGPALEAIEGELAASVDPKANLAELKKQYGYQHDQEFYDGLYQLLRVYLMLGNQLAPEPIDIKEELQARHRWLRGLGVAPLGDPPAEQERRAWLQFDFLMTQLDRAGEWAPKLDEEVVHRVRKKLEANYWVSQSYTQIRDVREDQAGEERLEDLLGAAGVELFGPVQPVSKIFSQYEWEHYFQRTIGERAAYLADQYQEMDARRKKSRDELEAELRGYYELEGRQRWRGFLEGLHVAPFDGVRGATDRLTLLGSRRSPLPQLFDEVWLRQFVLTADEEKAKLVPRESPRRDPDNPDGPVKSWREQAQDAFARLAKAFGEVGKKPAGERVWALARDGRLSELDPLRNAFAEVKARLLEEILPQVPANQETYARRLFEETLDRAHEALLQTALEEVNAYWNKEVREVYRERCARRYPFTADAAEEAPLREVAALFNPVEGRVWVAQQALSRLKAYEVDGRGLLVAGPSYRDFIESSQRLRDALFAPDSKERKVELNVKLVKRPGVKSIRFVVGQSTFTWGDLPPGQRQDMTWAMDPGAKVSILGVDQTEWALEDFGNSPWGLVRLLASGTYDVENSEGRRFRYTWAFDLGAADQRHADVEFEVEREEARPVFERTLFVDLVAPPERVDQ